MMPPEPIAVFEASGTHRQVGQQIGEYCKPAVQRVMSEMRQGLPAGVPWEQLMRQAQVFLAPSRAAYPQYVEELAGIAEAAEVPFGELFLSMCEELWEKEMWRGARGCTDMAARGRATATGATLLAHTNDAAPAAAGPVKPNTSSTGWTPGRLPRIGHPHPRDHFPARA